MSDTPLRGWPYPVSTDKIAKGAVNIEELAEAVENQFFLATNAHTAAEPYTVYPVGMSLMYVSGSGTANGWPGNYGNIITIYSTTSNAWQWFYPYSTIVPVSLRLGYTGTWQPWQTVTGAGSPVAFAAGEGQVNTTSGHQVDSAKFTFPSGRFTQPPEVQVTARSTRPDYVSVSVSDITTSSMTIYVSRPTGDAPTTVNWNAAQAAAV